MAGLREQKKQHMRRTLSDTAAALFLERGFDGFRITDVAEACGVSEKTVYNYFPTKESLIMDRLEATATALRTAITGPGDPLDACLAMLATERAATATAATAATATATTATTAGGGDRYRRFGDLLRATPSLRAYRSEMHDRFVTIAAEALCHRTGLPPGDPGAEIAAHALIGLWRVQADSLRRHDDQARTAADMTRAAEITRAALTALRPT
ncbi:TetR/AcrR family transcriptional regulator [Actinoplanes couchii]|uniref:TetR family transcriptional regulator n=1 Tax=Actinoplanes couchii TaxID=403638 RepID=A0ABQ3XNN2_9ACTN|nr:TetR/AcrR family transcriptional regulator [Actinoplanes couchii]MDR6319663.1 AcrR family transcriptional regulator [Actinoplanes couchii]GID60117.1 TetR family transcriptional regulator [Actinoplanes couchii]